MTDLFGNEKIRTLGLYQPYATLMLHGKIESRWVKAGKKPPFPKGKYLIYSTKKAYKDYEFKKMCPSDLVVKAKKFLQDDPSALLNGYAIAIGNLVEVVPMPAMWLDEAFYWPTVIDDAESALTFDGYKLWALVFKDVRRIDLFPFKGKQGVGILTEEQKLKIKFI